MQLVCYVNMLGGPNGGSVTVSISLLCIGSLRLVSGIDVVDCVCEPLIQAFIHAITKLVCLYERAIKFSQ